MVVELVPEILNKGELIFEIKIRGAQPSGKVEDFRKQLRLLLGSNAELEWPTDLDVASELSVCRDKFEGERSEHSPEERVPWTPPTQLLQQDPTLPLSPESMPSRSHLKSQP